MILCYCIDMRILGIDYGAKRVGVSVSDESMKFGLPLSVITNSDELVAELIKIAKDNETKEIVLGESRQYNMTANKILPEILALKSELEKLGYIVHLELEFMTSMQARRLQGKNDMTDASAAALILQSYLDKRINERQYYIENMITYEDFKKVEIRAGKILSAEKIPDYPSSL